MKSEIIYRTKQSVHNIISQTNCFPQKVWLEGKVEKMTERRLLGFIPMPDRYVWSVKAYEEVLIEGLQETRLLRVSELTFESKKVIQKELLNMETWLRGKCKEYKIKN